MSKPIAVYFLKLIKIFTLIHVFRVEFFKQIDSDIQSEFRSCDGLMVSESDLNAEGAGFSTASFH